MQEWINEHDAELSGKTLGIDTHPFSRRSRDPTHVTIIVRR